MDNRDTDKTLVNFKMVDADKLANPTAEKIDAILMTLDPVDVTNVIESETKLPWSERIEEQLTESRPHSRLQALSEQLNEDVLLTYKFPDGLDCSVRLRVTKGNCVVTTKQDTSDVKNIKNKVKSKREREYVFQLEKYDQVLGILIRLYADLREHPPTPTKKKRRTWGLTFKGSTFHLSIDESKGVKYLEIETDPKNPDPISIIELITDFGYRNYFGWEVKEMSDESEEKYVLRVLAGRTLEDNERRKRYGKGKS